MKRSLLIAAIALVVAPALASSDILPITGVSGTMSYNAVTGQITPVDEQTRRIGPTVWSCTESSGYFWGGSGRTNCKLDWGDIANNVVIGGIGFNEFTNSQAANGDLKLVLVLYANDNGGGDTRKSILAGWIIDNIPASTHSPAEFWGYLWRLDLLGNNITMTGNDLDGDGLLDFSYVYYFKTIPTANARAGASLAVADPNNLPASAPGIENVFDWYAQPDFNNDPNMDNTTLYGTYWFGGNPFAQFYWEMMAPGCPNPGAHFKYCAADIGNYNCIVDLADLAQLLGNYGITSGATYAQGDIEPPDDFFPGDGDIDLGDLAELLGQYGDNCNN